MLGCDAGNDEAVDKTEAPEILSAAAAFGEREIEEEPLKNMKVSLSVRALSPSSTTWHATHVASETLCKASLATFLCIM